MKKQWVRVDGNAFLYGDMDEKHKPHGDGILYLYPDLCTVLRGNYSNGTLEKGTQIDILRHPPSSGLCLCLCLEIRKCLSSILVPSIINTWLQKDRL